MSSVIAYNVCNKNAVAKRTLIDKFYVNEAMVHFTFLLLLVAVAGVLVDSTFA